MTKILFVEDATSSQRTVQAILESEKFHVICAATIDEAKRLTTEDHSFALILLDLSLPDGEGLDLLRHWRSGGAYQNTPVLLLTGREDVDAKVDAFSLGAEDYILKPVNPRELKARVEARLRKASQNKMPVDTLQLGRLRLNFPLMRATVAEDQGETFIEFTAKEFRLVATLAQHTGKIFSRSQLVKEIWGKDMHVVNRTVDSHICGARRKMGTVGDYIESVTGSGYRLIAKD